MLEHVQDEPSAPHPHNLLSCPGCEGACPLGFGAEVKCPSCEQTVEVPAELRKQRDQRRAELDVRRNGDARWQSARQVHQRWWRSPLFVAPLAFVAPFVSAVYAYFSAYRYERYGRAGLLWLLGIGLIHGMTSWLLLGRKHELVRHLLLARPGAHPGAPPDCRVCAKPLSVAPGSTETSCDHCGADNLLARHGETATQRPDVLDATQAYRAIFGESVNERAARLYPVTILVGFVVLAVLTYLAIEAPRGY